MTESFPTGSPIKPEKLKLYSLGNSIHEYENLRKLLHVNESLYVRIHRVGKYRLESADPKKDEYVKINNQEELDQLKQSLRTIQYDISYYAGIVNID